MVPLRFHSTLWRCGPFHTAEGMQASAVIFGTARVASEPFETIVRLREAQVLRTAFRILGNWADAEDVAQETFLRLHRHGLGFANEAAMSGWLYRVTANLCFDRTRSARPVTELPHSLSH